MFVTDKIESIISFNFIIQTTNLIDFYEEKNNKIDRHFGDGVSVRE